MKMIKVVLLIALFAFDVSAQSVWTPEEVSVTQAWRERQLKGEEVFGDPRFYSSGMNRFCELIHLLELIYPNSKINKLY